MPVDRIDLMITGGTVVDGLGTAPRRAEVGVSGDRVVIIDEPNRELPPAAEVVDASGKIICPGFVDIHTHSDLTLLSDPHAQSSIRQGVTTAVVGNCGLGVAPIAAGADRDLLRSAVSYLDLDPAVDWRWDDAGGYLAALEAARPSINAATFVGQLPLHGGVVGFDATPPSPQQRIRMQTMLAAALEAGAVGLSTGLMYAPLTNVCDEELTALAETVAEHDAVFAWHLRDYADDLLGAVRQAIEIGAATGCRIQLSHLVAVGRRNWGAVADTLELVDAARQRGIDVGADVYPYLAGNAPLSQRLPAWAQTGGEQQIHDRLADEEVADRIRRHWAGDALGWSDVTISRAPDPAVQGQRVTALAERAGRDADDIALELLRQHGNAVMMTAGGRGRADLQAAITHPEMIIASDGQALDPDGPTGSGSPHPRSYGCFPRLFADWVRSGELSLAEAVGKCTSAPARRVGLTDRGVLAVGRPADLVVLDLETIADRATFDKPQQYPEGIDMVVVNGRVAVRHGEHTGERSGRTLRANTAEGGTR